MTRARASFLILGAFACVLGGCAKCEPVIKTEIKEIYIPVKCAAKMPIKPKYDAGDLQSVKALAKYYKECETILKECLK